MNTIVKIIFGLLIMSGSYYSYNFATAETRVRELCGQIKSGMTISELRTFGIEHELLRPRNESGINYMVESKTYGRYGCKVLLEAGIVKNAEYTFAD
ncbi:MAG: hypothetical protein NTW85_01870 [Methylococcales bacterium]|nr:hypothetical protein [Methylococcales bacterium]